MKTLLFATSLVLSTLATAQLAQEVPRDMTPLERQYSHFVVESIAIKEMPLKDALEELRKKADEASKGLVSLNFVFNAGIPAKTVTLNLSHVPLNEVIRYFADAASIKVRFDNAAITCTAASVPKSKVVEGQRKETGEDGKKILEDVSKAIKGVNVVFGSDFKKDEDPAQRNAVLLNFPASIWEHLTLEEKVSIAKYLRELTKSAIADPERYVPGLAQQPRAVITAFKAKIGAAADRWQIAFFTLPGGVPTPAGPNLLGATFAIPQGAQGKSAYSRERLAAILGATNDPDKAGREHREALVTTLNNGLVALGRVPLYQAYVDEKWMDPKNENFGWGASQGTILGHVRTGFIARATTYSYKGGMSVGLMAPIGSQSIAYALQSEFATLNPRIQKQHRLSGLLLPKPVQSLVDYPLTNLTEMLDPFEKKSVILSNAKGGIAAAYKCVPEQAVAGIGVLGIAETTSGAFLGYFREKTPLTISRLTWAQVGREKNNKFSLSSKQRTPIERGGTIMRMASLTKPTRRAIVLTKPEQVRLLPIHYETLLRHGLDVIRAELEAPTDNGFEADAVVAVPKQVPQQAPVGYDLRTQSMPLETTMKFLEWSENMTTVEMVQKVQERTIEVWFNGNQILKNQTSPWKTISIKQNMTVENDLDGTCMFTDGEHIYAVSKSGFRYTLETFDVLRNTLFKER